MKKLRVKVNEVKELLPEDQIKGGFEIKEDEHLFTGYIHQSVIDGSLSVVVHDIGTFRFDTKDLVHSLIKKIIKERV